MPASPLTSLVPRHADDQEFCVMPLTHDFEANPFRFDAETCRGSQLLWHSILALSYKHLHRETGAHSSEAKMHKTKALQMLRDMEGATQDTALEATFLDAVLILMTLDVSSMIPRIYYKEDRPSNHPCAVCDLGSRALGLVPEACP